jgi:GT2 family glycosyltransferase
MNLQPQTMTNRHSNVAAIATNFYCRCRSQGVPFEGFVSVSQSLLIHQFRMWPTRDPLSTKKTRPRSATRQRMTEIHVLIVTAGDSPLLSRTLQSIANAEQPANFASVVVVDTRSGSDTRSICQQACPSLRTRYVVSNTDNKSDALNHILATLPSDALVIFSDDDIRFSPQALTAYAKAAEQSPQGMYFGGPFACEYEAAPSPALLSLLPVAAVGWTPHPQAFNPRRDVFLGFNWAAFNSDIQRLGGFDRNWGPGSPTGAIGQDINMQRRLRDAGMRGQFVEDALVHHFVSADRCTTQWAYQRARRNGINYGVARRERSIADIALSHWKFTLQLFANTAARVLTAPIPDSGIHIRARYRQQKALGYFNGFRLPPRNAMQASQAITRAA